MKTCLARIVLPALSGALLLGSASPGFAAPPGSSTGPKPLTQRQSSPKPKTVRPFPGTSDAYSPEFGSPWGSHNDFPHRSYMGMGHVSPGFHGPIGGITSLFTPSFQREAPWSFGYGEERLQPGGWVDPLLHDPLEPLLRRYDLLSALTYGGDPSREFMLQLFGVPTIGSRFFQSPMSSMYDGRVNLWSSAAPGQGRATRLRYSAIYSPYAGMYNPYAGYYNPIGSSHRMIQGLADPLAWESQFIPGRMGLGGLGLDPVLMEVFGYSMSPYMPGYGGIGGFGPFYPGSRRNPYSGIPYGMPYSRRYSPSIGRAPSPPPAPSRADQRAAFEKLNKALETVESLAKKEAWHVLSSGLAEQKDLATLPDALEKSLRNIHAEATLLDGLTQLRANITSVWRSAPDVAVLEQHLEAVRSATGDAELTGRVRRILAVKAAWEGHDEVARLLLPGPSTPDIDTELKGLRESLASSRRNGGDTRVVSAKYSPAISDEERDIVCLKVTRKILVGIDEHLDSGQYSVSVQLKGLGPWRTALESKIKALADDVPQKDPKDSLDSILNAVAKALGRTLSPVDALIVRRMHADGKSVDEIAQVLR